MDPNLDLLQIDVLLVGEMVKSDQIKVFLQCNRRVLSVLGVEKKSQIHAMIVVAKVAIKLQKRYL